MKKVKYLIILVFVAFTALSFTKTEEPKAYKCMIQMTNYTGENAYIVISLINPKGEYEETLFVQGEDDEWYHDISEWWKYYGKKRTNIDAITGATIAGGSRSISVFMIEDSKIDTGYSIRFETAVEDQEYHTKDVQFELTSKTIKSKKEGTGFIRYVRMIPN